ncbi:MAG: DUF4342 domain-containing protein [Clostridia bacterium]|jgi:ElaB/YqjD/DUF883 family membrane-anchored ribosome-binding protein|nr:DUF4342 domain-containing protein [Clostridia bacterium]
MEITLEKIELVKDRTGVSYKEAKDALENAGGSVVDAIIAIEENINQKGGKPLGASGGAVVEKLKELIKKGNVSKILIKRDGEVVLNLPVNIGILGTVLAPIPIVLGTIAALGAKCDIEVVKDDGTILDVSEMAMDTFEDVREKGGEIFDDVKKRGGEVYREVKGKASDALDKVNTKMDIDLSDEDDFFEDMAEEAGEVKDKVDDLAKDAKDAFDDVLDELNKEK